MVETKPVTMIPFKPITLQDQAYYDSFLHDGDEHGCEYTFANLYLWEREKIAVLHGHIVLFSPGDPCSVYFYPLGHGDKKAVLDAVIADAQARGIPCRIIGLSAAAKETLESLYPGRFQFQSDPGLFDYVYTVDDLADLPGRKYHGKRNHLYRFEEAFPEYTVQPLGEDNLQKVRQMTAEWYRARLAENPEEDFHREQEALEKALREYRELQMEGLVLFNGEDVLAFTLADRMTEDTMDVHFEKARSDIPGAYAAVNCAFARHIRNKYPAVRYLDREEDMGLEGLRKAKQSYHPHHMVEKYMACLREAENDD